MSTAELDTKQNWDDCHFDQHPTHSIHLSGCTVICGQLKICSPTGFTSSFGAGLGKTWVSDASGIGTWQDSKSLSITKLISQASHGFAVKDVVGWNALGCYTKAIADGTYNGEVLGLVTKCYNANCFDLTQGGYFTGLTGLIASCTYFLSDVTPGLLTTTETTTVGHIDKSVLIATSTTSGWVLPYPGYYISSGGTGGGGTLTGATNGVCKYNSQNVCLGGTFTGTVLLCGSGTGNKLNICTIDGSCNSVTSFCCGAFNSCSCNVGTTWWTCLSHNGFATLYAQNGANTTSNSMVFRPDAVYLTIGGTSSGPQYVGDYCTTFNNNLRSIPDTGWVKRYTVGGWSNLANGSTVMGCNTVASGTTINCNTFYGVCAGTNMTTGCANVGVGFRALNGNTTGCDNVAVGWGALKVNNIGLANIGIGCQALTTNTTGCYNIALGYNTLSNNISGNNNFAAGFQTLALNTGDYNIGLGYLTLLNNAGGSNNTAIGCQAMYNNTSGAYNIAIGAGTLCANLTAGCNVAVGTGALRFTTASNNIGIGYQALTNNTSGTRNIAVGVSALQCNITGNDNTAFGHSALCCNNSTNNTAVGEYALTANRTGYDNTAMGLQALSNNLSGGANIAIGVNSHFNNTAGSNNVVIGNSAGFYATGSGNVFLGYGAGTNEAGSNKLYIANSGTVTPLIYGDFSTTMVCVNGCLCASSTMTATNFILSSDCRLKTCIEPISISPVNIEYKQYVLISEPNQLRYGVIAQDLQKVNPELVRVGADGMLSIAQMDLVFKELAYLKNKVIELENKIR